MCCFTATAGTYTASTLPIGKYSVAVEAKGFKKAIRNGIDGKANDNLTLDVTLEIGDVTTEVTVEANPVQVELQSSGSGKVTEGYQIDGASRIDATMQVGDVTQLVEVSSQADLLQTDSATLRQVVEGLQFDEMRRTKPSAA